MKIRLNKEKIIIFLRAIRINQWIKNVVIFIPIVFTGKLFEIDLFLKSLFAFFVFCLLSSTSYLLNDIIDLPYDIKHPVKKNRPLASGVITIPEASSTIFIFVLISLVASLFFSISFFLLSFVFLVLHLSYSLYLKKHAIVDIFTISFSFMMRAFAGEVATGFHIPIWLFLTIFFGSLFMATVKRHAEFVAHGKETRISLTFYKAHLLDFLTTTFATLTIIAYSFYTYFEKLPQTKTIFTDFFSTIFPNFEARKLMMVTIPFVVYGIARYAQLLYEREEGERPEKIIVNDKPLVTTMGAWGLIIILLIYVL